MAVDDRLPRRAGYIENGPLNTADPVKVSKSVRREVLDVLFMRNHFTFTSLRDVMNFSSMFRTSASKLQHVRIYDRADDYACSDLRSKQIEKARRYVT